MLLTHSTFIDCRINLTLVEVSHTYTKGAPNMKTMSKEYSTLFNEITDVSEELSKLINRLMDAQKRTEEMFMEDDVEDHEAKY